jgi:hypothetical protein
VICDRNASCETMKTNATSMVHNCFFYRLGLVVDVIWTRQRKKAFGDGEKQVYMQHDDGTCNDQNVVFFL